MRILSLIPFVAASVVLSAVYPMCRVLIWAWRGGMRVVVPWLPAGLLTRPAFPLRYRTRIGSFLSDRDPGCCSLLLWKRPRNAGVVPLLADVLTGFTGILAVALDCSLEAGGKPWVMISVELRSRRSRLSGPNYASIANAAIRHHRVGGALDFILGRAPEHRGLLGRAILRQPDTPFAVVLRRPLRDRFTHGGVTPADLTRAPAAKL